MAHSSEVPDPLDPAEAARLLADLVDVLLPGADGWPSGSAVGVQGALATRIILHRGEAGLDALLKAILSAGGPFSGHDEAGCIAIVEALERNEPERFGWARDAAFIAYYESPFVAAAIEARGHAYDLRPHMTGYPMPRFDLARDTPKHGRGHYVPTDAVRAIDISGLNLSSDSTLPWGLKR